MKQLDVLQSIVEGMGATFISANLFESNISLDSKANNEFPVYIHLAPTKFKGSDTEFGAPDRILNMFGFWLTRIPNATIDYSTNDVQPYIDLMQKNAEKMIALLCLDKISEDYGIKEWDITATYSKFDSGVFGVSVQFQWLTNDGYRVCTT